MIGYAEELVLPSSSAAMCSGLWSSSDRNIICMELLKIFSNVHSTKLFFKFYWRQYVKIKFDTFLLWGVSIIMSYVYMYCNLYSRGVDLAYPRNSQGVAHKRCLPQSVSAIPDLRSSLDSHSSFSGSDLSLCVLLSMFFFSPKSIV